MASTTIRRISPVCLAQASSMKSGLQAPVGVSVSNSGFSIDRSHPARSRVRRSSTSSPSTRSEEHTSELQSLMRISYDVFCLKKKTTIKHKKEIEQINMTDKHK